MRVLVILLYTLSYVKDKINNTLILDTNYQSTTFVFAFERHPSSAFELKSSITPQSFYSFKTMHDDCG
jgi:hypothetical protein